MKIRLVAAEKFSNIRFHENPSSGSRKIFKQNFMKIRLVAAEKFSNIKFHENPSSGS